MHISLTPELEARIRRKVESGLYNNASEVVREALRFMETNEELVNRIKLELLQQALRPGMEQAARGEFVDLDIEEVIADARNNSRA